MPPLTLTRQQLHDRVWTTPTDKLAGELGLSGRGLGKLCARHDIPVPPRGYWAKKAAGKRVSHRHRAKMLRHAPLMKGLGIPHIRGGRWSLAPTQKLPEIPSQKGGAHVSPKNRSPVIAASV